MESTTKTSNDPYVTESKLDNTRESNSVETYISKRQCIWLIQFILFIEWDPGSGWPDEQIIVEIRQTDDQYNKLLKNTINTENGKKRNSFHLPPK